MGVVRVDVAPELLRWAVRRAGWDKETALRRAPKLADWLAGASRPTLKQLEKFVSDMHAPFGMLVLPEPPVETIPIPDMRTIRDAGVVEPSADLLDTVSTLGEVRWGSAGATASRRRRSYRWIPWESNIGGVLMRASWTASRACIR